MFLATLFIIAKIWKKLMNIPVPGNGILFSTEKEVSNQDKTERKLYHILLSEKS